MKNRIFNLWGFVVFLTVFIGCKEYDNPPPIFEEIKDTAVPQRKVLLISIDGLGGEDLEELAPETIKKLQQNSKYSYETLITNSEAGGWASMMTGTSFSKHQIFEDNFERDLEHDYEHGEMTNFRNVLDYVTQYKSVTTALITPWQNLRNYLRNADFIPEVESDEAVRDSTVKLLESVNNLGAVVVNFKEVLKAGENGGFTLDNTNYKETILKTDTHLGALLTAVDARKNAEKEDWLIIVTTSQGGNVSVPKKGFVLLYNSAFKEFELKKSGFNGVHFNDKNVKATLSDDNGLYDAGESKSFTVQMDVKFDAIPNGYSSFFSKSTNLQGQSLTGWQWAYYPGGGWVVTVGGTLNGGSGKQQINAVTPPGNSEWHTLTMTVDYVDASTRNLTMYMDGVFQTTANISARKSLSTTEEFRVGHRAGDNDVLTSYYAANLAYFNTALSAEVVQETFGLTDFSDHPNYGDLIGFWPMDEGAEGVFSNTAPGGYNMNLSGPYEWEGLQDFYPPSTPKEPIISDLSIPTTASDVAALTLYWMKINILPEFSYDGKPYLKNFEMEFLKD